MNKGVLLLLVVVISLSVSDAWPFRSRRHRYICPYPLPIIQGKRAIKDIDLNGDGVLDMTELQQSGLDKRDVDDLKEFVDLDTAGNSDVTIQDVQKAMERLEK